MKNIKSSPISCNETIVPQANNSTEIVSVCVKKPIRTQADSGQSGRKLRLVLFEECNRNCVGCCNKDFNFSTLPVCYSYKGYDLIMLTGGEPMLYPEKVAKIITQIRLDTDAPIILYTAFTADKEALSLIADEIDGIIVALHENSDVKPFLEFDEYHMDVFGKKKSYRLNVFNGVEIDLEDIKGKWKVKSGIEWIKNCPLPDGEVLMLFDNRHL